MRQKSNSTPASSETLVRNIRRATRKHHAAEEKIRIVLDGLRGETSIAELCRREGIAESMYYSWSKEFLEAGKRRLAGDTARAATTDEVKQLRREAQDLKEVVAEQALELRRPSRGRGFLLSTTSLLAGHAADLRPPRCQTLAEQSNQLDSAGLSGVCATACPRPTLYTERVQIL